ncbi:hypothetical protein [uncultured Peptoniphilus sp.]|uniref:hypothetical protein n=1 Tax=uncultured Peptoniphilus sp. TaxID=254354 RepID=UPI002591D025|nr:hypothetical protein [uncultured Peptoniphilus sp.]
MMRLKLSGRNLQLTIRRLIGLCLMAIVLVSVLTIAYSIYTTVLRFICIVLLKIVELSNSSFGWML